MVSGEYSWEEDAVRLREMGLEKLLELFKMQIKNIWRVDGLYFQGIERRFGVNAATEIDKETWRILARIEARDLKRLYGLEKVDDINIFMDMLLNTSWALYQTKKKVEINKNEGVFKVVSCKVQEARIKKGLGVFPCKPVRLGYLEEFAREMNPEIEVKVISCPPDEKDPEFWCGWKFILKSK